MEIVVNHITRMSNSRICVAGLDVETFDHVRPTTPPSDLITRELLREHGGPFGVGALVDIGRVIARPNPPETEDHGFVTARARHVEDLSAEEYLGLLAEVSTTSLASAFGPDLKEVRQRKFAIDEGHGTRSLAVLKLRGRARVTVSPWGKPQVELRYPDTPAYLPLTDVRFFEPDHATVRSDVVTDVSRRLARGTDAYLMLGLARAHQVDGDDRARHWVQTNGICLADSPVGDVP